jgi:hypothetical protein
MHKHVGEPAEGIPGLQGVALSPESADGLLIVPLGLLRTPQLSSSSGGPGEDHGELWVISEA